MLTTILKRKRLWLGLFTVAFVTITGSGCKEDQQKTPFVPHAQVLPKNEITLPDVPNFSNAIQAASPQKNIYSAWGLIYHKTELIDTEVRVRGKIVDVSRDCPEYTLPKKHRKTQPVKTKCTGLSVIISSPDDHPSKLRLAGYHPYYHPHLQPGMEVDVVGKYTYFTSFRGMTYVEPEDGLIEVYRFNGMAVDKRGHFTTNKTEINEMIAKGSLAEIPRKIEPKNQNDKN